MVLRGCVCVCVCCKNVCQQWGFHIFPVKMKTIIFRFHCCQFHFVTDITCSARSLTWTGYNLELCQHNYIQNNGRTIKGNKSQRWHQHVLCNHIVRLIIHMIYRAIDENYTRNYRSDEPANGILSLIKITYLSANDPFLFHVNVDVWIH